MTQRTLYLAIVGTFLCTLFGSLAVAEDANDAVPRALFNYVDREEKVFEWKLNESRDVLQGTIYDMTLTSQQWQGIVWKHALTVCEPKEVRYPKHVLLFVTGGSNGNRPGQGDLQRGLALANLCGARVATIHQVPNQPLFEGRKEDDLITDTWLKYLETGDENWPLLFPMVKTAVKSMDAIEDLAKSEWNTSIEGFVITGASKRGWTSWLTAVADERIIATAPMVIDVLNFRPQMQHQLSAWGKYSEQIVDYTSKGLIKEGDESPRDEHLRRMMDPYTYRKQLDLPKLLVNGTNDRYWVADAMSLYWEDLVGPKNVLQIPNAGHGLDGGHELTLSTVAVFFQHAATKTPLPQVTWDDSNALDSLEFKVSATRKPASAHLWIAHSGSLDFREAAWKSQTLDGSSSSYQCNVPRPQEGHVAYYCELKYEQGGIPFSLCTVIHCE